LERKTIIVESRSGRRDTQELWDIMPCICVAPTISQTVIAVGDILSALENNSKIYYCEVDHAVPEKRVFDFHVTCEHRLFKTTEFKYLSDFELPKSIKKMVEKYRTVPSENDPKSRSLVNILLHYYKEKALFL